MNRSRFIFCPAVFILAIVVQEMVSGSEETGSHKHPPAAAPGQQHIPDQKAHTPEEPAPGILTTIGSTVAGYVPQVVKNHVNGAVEMVSLN